MTLFISTNMYKANELNRVLPYLELNENIGVEIFPFFEEEIYEEELKNCINRLEKAVISFHGPYYMAEHSAPKGSEEYKKTMELVRKTLEYSKKLNSRHFVFHHNNCRVDKAKKAEIIDIACQNFREIEKMFAEHNIPLVVENAGVLDRGNMLFDQNEFIDICKRENYKVLIDIGHAKANGWDLLYVIDKLKEQIVAYHLHNNDGIHDSHFRIHNGVLDFEKFIEAVPKITPKAEFIIEYGDEVADDEEGIKKDIMEMLEKAKMN